MVARFITLEGGEGAGKTTQIKLLADNLRSSGQKVITTREPGGAPEAERIRDLLVTGAPGRWTALSEILLLYAARQEHLRQTIRPALAAGTWVVCDRFSDSTRAYQGHAMGAGVEVVSFLDRHVVGETEPDLTFILDLPVEEGLRRARERAGGEDRYEQMGAAFHERLRQAFLEIAAAAPERCVVIDGTAPIADVAATLWDHVRHRFAPDLEPVS